MIFTLGGSALTQAASKRSAGAQNASGAGLPSATDDLGPESRPGRVLRVQAGIVIAGSAHLDRLGQLAGDE
jgi:hypothetical protein